MNEKVFSIITPSLNNANKLEATIRSVLAQNSELFEYIIVDGESTDDTCIIIEKYKDSLLYINEPDHGIYDAMNKGITIAKGDYIYFLGAGDYLESNVLEMVYEYIQKNKYEVIYGDVYLADQGRVYGGRFNKFKISVKNICHQSIFYDRRLFDQFGLYNLNYRILADHVFNINCFGEKEIKKKYICKIIATYEGQGISNRIRDERFFEDIEYIIKNNLGRSILLYSRIYNRLKKLAKRALKIKS